MSARRAKKRTTRTVRINPFRCGLEDNELVLVENRQGVRHVIRVKLGSDETWLAMSVARAARSHVQNVRDGRAQALVWAQQNLDELGGAK